ncbi:MAG: GNAT family N-acetyltransferase [Emcibacteraceae bacterium]|nr:GNAT family N-acetyltransferase [Emcibacteraceae bacterium]
MKKYARSPDKKNETHEFINEEFYDDISKYYWLRERLGYRYFKRFSTQKYHVPKIKFTKKNHKYIKQTTKLNATNLSMLQAPSILYFEYIRLLHLSYKKSNNSTNIWREFLEAWPPKYRDSIENTDLGKKTKSLMSSYSGKLQNEHGDFTKNNIRRVQKDYYATDFDFFKRRQPCGFDIYDILTSFNVPAIIKKIVTPNYKLNKLKYELITVINDFVDASEGMRPGSILMSDRLSAHIINNSVSTNNPIEAARVSQTKEDRLVLHYIYCKIRQQYTWIVVNRHRNNVSIAGSKNKLLEGSSSPFLSIVGPDWLKRLVQKSNGNVTINGITDHEWIKECFYDFEGDEDYYLEIKSTSIQPFRNQGAQIKKSLREDYRRLSRKIEKIGIYKLELTKCNSYQFNKMKEWHSARWPKGQFAQKGPYLEYLERLFKGDKLHCFSLYLGNKIQAINCGLLIGTEFISLVNVTSYKYETLSLGKFLIMEVFHSYKNITFNFGDGAEGYKKIMSTDSNIIYDVNIKSKYLIHKLKKIKRKFF